MIPHLPWITDIIVQVYYNNCSTTSIDSTMIVGGSVFLATLRLCEKLLQEEKACPENFEGAGKTRGDCSRRAVQGLGNLLVGHLFDIL